MDIPETFEHRLLNRASLMDMAPGNYDRWKFGISGVAQQLFEFGVIMDQVVNHAERLNGSPQMPALVIIEPLTLTRTCILSILRRELPGFEIVEMATTDGLDFVSGRDVCLVALSTGDRPFLYLVKEDDAYVVAGKADSAAAIAYRNICN